MSSVDQDKIKALMRQAGQLPYGEVKFSLLDEAKRLTDSLQDIDLMFATRMELIVAATFGGHSEETMTAFAWCLAQLEHDPKRFARHRRSLLWYFKYVVNKANDFPQISLDQIEKLIEQMTTMYRRYGYNMRPVYNLRFTHATDMGNKQTAPEWLERMLSEPRDRMADCLACDADNITEYYDLVDNPEKAVDEAQPNLAGERKCAEVPHRTLNCVLRPLAKLGRYDEADRYQRRGYELIRGNSEFLGCVAYQLVYLAHRGRLVVATNMFGRHLIWALCTFELRSRNTFYIAAIRLLRTLAESKSTRKLKLPREFPLYRADETYDLSVLIDWFEVQQQDIARRFDLRNGNSFFSTAWQARMNY